MPSQPQISSVVSVEERSWLRAVAPHALIVLVLLAFTIRAHFRPEYLLLTLFWATLTFAGPRSRRFAWIALPVLLVGVLYDKILPYLLPYRPSVHVADLFHLELALFGVSSPGGPIILSEWFATRTHAILDLLCGFAYMTYMFETFVVVGFLYLARDEERSLRMAWAFLVCNIIGQAMWLTLPAAPPWYVAAYGLGPAVLDAAPSAAGAARFDALVGFPYFEQFYARSRNVHGAMPSLHAAYPVVVAFWCWSRSRLARWSSVAFAVLVCFAAVYLYHHYLVDVVAGIATALASCAVIVFVRRGR